ncbi:MAG: PAS domain-containing sensor histidine kinase [Planctomycetota bacterium]
MTPLHGETLRLRGRWVHGLRLFFLLIFLGTVTFHAWEGFKTFDEALKVFFWLSGAAGVLTLVSLILHSHIRNVRRFLVWQASGDLILLICFLHQTGGLESVALPMIHALVATSAILLGRRAARAMSVAASTGISISAGLYLSASMASIRLHYVVEPWAWPHDLSLGSVIGKAVLFCALLVMMGELAGRLAESLGRARVATRDILENLEQGVLVTDNEGRVAFCNGALRRLLDIEGDPTLRLVTEAGFPESVQERVFSGRHDLREIDIQTDGSVMPVECQAAPLEDPRYGGRGMILTLTDIRERREIERMRSEKRRGETIEVIAAGLAHELRNPLAALRSGVQTLREEARSLNASHQSLLDLVLRESDRLDRIVGEFLDFSKPRPKISTSFRLAGVVDEVLELLDHDPRRGSVELRREVPETIRLLADREQVKKVLVNLVLNALQAMESSGQGSKVTVGARTKPGRVVLQITDDGPGFAPEILASPFTPFVTTRADGTGLGLAMVERVARDHGGSARILNRPEGGSVVEVEFPPAPA